ncbi:ABC transporter permease [Aestuariispira insulae]|uniref:Putative ABC transport system permease protein n=1 Tax=Aestuariispira insulae TaxID=1461337 RepID=A0A3D9HF22_9PROT|nr:FtsX-like permease family protein [Aestuariispira insulae]RED48079.1 putative ABC transport system permease protein [Aestuariispira insulae]
MIKLAFKLAMREMRGGLKGFRVFLACLALGVAVVASVGAVSQAIEQGLRANARLLLGGEVSLRLTHKPAEPDQVAWLKENSDGMSAIAILRAMAVRPDGADRRLVEVKAVDGTYPIFGGFELASGAALHDVLVREDGYWNAVVASNLLERLNLQVRDYFRLGQATLRIADVIAVEPDRSTQAFELGPRVVVPQAALPETELIQPGSLVRFYYRLDIPADESAAVWEERLKTQFPDAGWRIRNLENAAPNIQRFVDRVQIFLTLIGLTALLVGGVGVGNAAQAYLATRNGTIATLKCLGAPSRLIFGTYLSQLMVLGTLGSLGGALIGAVMPTILAPILADKLPVTAETGFYPMPLLLALGFGIGTTLVFSLWPLARARMVPAASLFHDAISGQRFRSGRRLILITTVLGVLMAGIAIATSKDPRLAAIFVVCATATLLLFRGTAWAVIRLTRKMPHPRSARLRLALANLHRPGSPTSSVVLSLGLGLTVLSAVSLIEANLNREVRVTLSGEAPSFYFIDIQPHQIADFRSELSAFPTVSETGDTPMLRGRITALKGVPSDQITPPADFAWVLRGDRGMTWARTPPKEGSEVVEGDWWPADYSGKPLVSFDVHAGKAFGLAIGDKVTVNILGREVETTIANFREIDWQGLGLNFVMIFSPGLLESAPQMYIATVHLDAEKETALERAVVDKFPNISSIRVKEILAEVAKIIESLGMAVRTIAMVAILTGVLVLAGAIAAGHYRRIYDSVVLKVLGATRRDVMAAYMIEYALLGVITAIIAGFIGTLAGYGVIRFVMDTSWEFDAMALMMTLVAALILTVGIGGFGAWNALGRKAAPFLRND